MNLHLRFFLLPNLLPLIFFVACASQKKQDPYDYKSKRIVRVRTYSGAQKHQDLRNKNQGTEQNLAGQAVRRRYLVPIQKISSRGTFLHIEKGKASGISINDNFLIVTSAPKSKKLVKIARAKVVALRPKEAFLRVEKRFSRRKIRVGDLARLLKLANR